MTCAECQDLLLDLSYGELEPARAAEVKAHVAGCAACQAELALLEGTRRTLAPLRELEEPSPGFDAAILRAARTEASLVSDGLPGAVIETVASSRPLGVSAASIDTSARVIPLPRSGRSPWVMRVAFGGSLAAAAALALVVSTQNSQRPEPATETNFQIHVRTPADLEQAESRVLKRKMAAPEPGKPDELKSAPVLPPPPPPPEREQSAAQELVERAPPPPAGAPVQRKQARKSKAAKDEPALSEPYEGSGGDGFDRPAAKGISAGPGGVAGSAGSSGMAGAGPSAAGAGAAASVGSAAGALGGAAAGQHSLNAVGGRTQGALDDAAASPAVARPAAPPASAAAPDRARQEPAPQPAPAAEQRARADANAPAKAVASSRPPPAVVTAAPAAAELSPLAQPPASPAYAAPAVPSPAPATRSRAASDLAKDVKAVPRGGLAERSAEAQPSLQAKAQQAQPEQLEQRAAAARHAGDYPGAAALFRAAARLRLDSSSSDRSTTAWDIAHAVQCLASAGSFEEARKLRSYLARAFASEDGPIAAAAQALQHAPQAPPGADGAGELEQAP